MTAPVPEDLVLPDQELLLQVYAAARRGEPLSLAGHRYVVEVGCTDPDRSEGHCCGDPR